MTVKDQVTAIGAALITAGADAGIVATQETAILNLIIAEKQASYVKVTNEMTAELLSTTISADEQNRVNSLVVKVTAFSAGVPAYVNA